MTLRIATVQDAQAIAALERTCFTVPWSQDAIAGDLRSNPAAFYLLAEEEGRVVGYVGMWHVLDEAQVTNLAVHPEHRRKGIGTTLLAALAVKAKAEGIETILLEVRERNIAAIALYESMGFVRDGLRKGYYPDDGDAAVLMSRKV